MNQVSVPCREYSRSFPHCMRQDNEDRPVSQEEIIKVERALLDVKRERFDIQRRKLQLKLEKLDTQIMELDVRDEKLAKNTSKPLKVDQIAFNTRCFHLAIQREIAQKDREALNLEREAARMDREKCYFSMNIAYIGSNTRIPRFQQLAFNQGTNTPATHDQDGASIQRPGTAPPAPMQMQRTLTGSANATKTTGDTATVKKPSKVQKLRLIMGWLGSEFPDSTDEEVMRSAEMGHCLKMEALQNRFVPGAFANFPFRNETQILGHVKMKMQSAAHDDFTREYRGRFCDLYGDLAVLAFVTLMVLGSCESEKSRRRPV